jgi:hypothetical protein
MPKGLSARTSELHFHRSFEPAREQQHAWADAYEQVFPVLSAPRAAQPRAPQSVQRPRVSTVSSTSVQGVCA